MTDPNQELKPGELEALRQHLAAAGRVVDGAIERARACVSTDLPSGVTLIRSADGSRAMRVYQRSDGRFHLQGSGFKSTTAMTHQDAVTKAREKIAEAIMKGEASVCHHDGAAVDFFTKESFGCIHHKEKS